MADADLDVVIRHLAKQQNKTILAAAKKQRDRYNGLAAKAKDKDAKARQKLLAKEVMDQAGAAARRILISCDNAADSYARAMRQAAAAELPKPMKVAAPKAEAPEKTTTKKTTTVKKAKAPKTSVKKATKKA